MPETKVGATVTPADAQAAARFSVLIVDDHPMVRDGLAGLIERHGLEIAGLAGTGREAIAIFGERHPEIVLMDVRLPDMDGIAALQAIRELEKDAKVVMLSSLQGDAWIYRAIRAGASGYLLKGIEGGALVENLRRVAAGGRALSEDTAASLARYVALPQLSQREVQVLRLIAQGNSNKEAAAILFISEETVKMHVKSILAKLQAHDRTQAVVIAINLGLITL